MVRGVKGGGGEEVHKENLDNKYTHDVLLTKAIKTKDLEE